MGGTRRRATGVSGIAPWRAAPRALLALLGALVLQQQLALAQPNTNGVPRTDVAQACGLATPYLAPKMQNCVIDEIMGSNGTLVFNFKVAPGKVQHSVLFTLRSTGGAAVMRVYNSGSGSISGQVVYYNDAVTESFLRLPADQLAPNGEYTLVVQGMGGATQKLLLYLRVQTPSAGVRLAAADKAAIKDVMTACCPVKGGAAAPDICTQFLPNALAAKTADEDLCNLADFVCDEEGQLQKVDFSNANLNCPSFPEAFGSLPALETLMLRFNNFNGDTFQHVADVLAPAANLRRLMIGSANLTGTVPCSLVEKHSMKTLMFSLNKLEGTLPACVLESTTLEELYMSRAGLSGELPDVIPKGSSLRVWYAINKDPLTGEVPPAAFTGSIPPSIANAADLAFVELSSHQLTGGVPALPPAIRMWESQSNKLDGSVASPLPASLVYFDAMNNSLTGNLPDFSAAKDLTLLDLSANALTGGLPDSLGDAGGALVYMDVSQNQLGGDVDAGGVWAGGEALQYLFLQENGFTGTLPASLGANPGLVALNVAFNSLGGGLNDFADALTPARAASPQQQQQQAGGGSGRRLLAGAPHAAGAQVARGAAMPVATAALAKKLYGSWSTAPSGWSIDTQSVRDLATNNAKGARRRLLQAAAPLSAADIQAAVAAAQQAAGGGTQPVMVSGSDPNGGPTDAELQAAIARVKAQQEQQLQQQQQRAAGAAAAPAAAASTARPAAEPAAAEPAAAEPAAAEPAAAEPAAAEPAAAAPAAEPTVISALDPTAATSEPAPDAAAEPQQDPAAAAPSTAAPKSASPSAAAAPSAAAGAASTSAAGPGAAAAAGGPGPSSLPTRSALAGNAYLYFNASNNQLTGAVPEALGGLEMFRTPANSSDPYDAYVFSRGGPDRTLDLTYNSLYGPFPAFVLSQPADLADACLCTTTFNVSDGNVLYCPTKDELSGVGKLSAGELSLLKEEGYTCLEPNVAGPTLLADYLAKGPSGWLAAAPARGDLTAPLPRARAPVAHGGGRSKASSSGALSGGAIAGVVIGVLAGVAILGSLAYFVGYKRFYRAHQATSFKRGEIPDGPLAAGFNPSAAYGVGAHQQGGAGGGYGANGGANGGGYGANGANGANGGASRFDIESSPAAGGRL